MKMRLGPQFFSMLLLALAAFCLLEFVLQCHIGIYREYAIAFLSTQWFLLFCLVVWCATFLFLTFCWEDLPLAGLLLIMITIYFIDHSVGPSMDALTLLAGVTLGKGVISVLMEENKSKLVIPYSSTAIPHFLKGLVGVLAFASWWHLDMPDNFYQGPRWMGLWNNPNIYGMLMGVGAVLSAGLLVDKRWQREDGWKKRKLFLQSSSGLRPPSSASTSQGKFLRSLRLLAAVKPPIFNPLFSMLLLAAGMMGVGLVMSYSRGAWLGTATGLTYLTWSCGKLKWRYVLPFVAVAAVVILFLWGSTLDSAPWYIKRADLGRPSAQNRATAWRAGLEIMRDHPLGVGWNNAIKIYAEKYSPPEGGPGALATNDYLMLGTELGIPALLCFVAYVALCYRKSSRTQKSGVRNQESIRKHLIPPLSPFGAHASAKRGEGEAIRATCLAGALVFLVAFWFDGGLFKLPTAAVFWILLELGATRGGKVNSGVVLFRPAAARCELS